MTTTFLQAIRYQGVIKVNGHKVKNASLDFLKNKLQVTTVRDSHYFEDVDKLIVFSGKALATDLSGQRCLIEIGVANSIYPFPSEGRLGVASLAIIRHYI